jgi:TPR repeat protein
MLQRFLLCLMCATTPLLGGGVPSKAEQPEDSSDRALRFSEELRAQAEQGDPEAQYRLGCCYVDALGVVKNSHRGMAYFQLAADQGHEQALHKLVGCYNRVFWDSSNHDAVRRMTLAADLGNVEAQFLLGCWYHGDKVVGKDLRKAFHYFELAATQGHEVAQHNTGILYYRGRGVETDLTKALDYLEQAAAQGHDNSDRVIKNFINPLMAFGEIVKTHVRCGGIYEVLQQGLPQPGQQARAPCAA